MMITLHQCMEIAKNEGFGSMEFLAYFPVGPVKCKWLDAHFGMFVIDLPGLNDSFVTVNAIDKEYPKLEVVILNH